MNPSEQVKALWDNRQLVQFKNTPYLWMVGVFFVSISLISSPHYLGISQGIGQIRQFEGLEASFSAMYDEGLPCLVNEEANMVCTVENTTDTFGTYQWHYTSTYDLTATTESTLYFGEEQFAAVYVNEEDNAYILEGTYNLLVGFDFTLINTLPYEGTLLEHQQTMTDSFLSAIYHSTTDQKIIYVYVSQMFQTLIYIGVLTLVMLLLNLDLTRKKIRLIEANKIILAGMVGPALATALIGLIYPPLGSIIFPFIYGFRMMVVYFYLRKNREKLITPIA